MTDQRLAAFARWSLGRIPATGGASLAERALGLACHRIRDPRLRADVLAEAAEARLAAGHVPRHLVQAYAAELACADELQRAKSHDEAAASVIAALRLASHRVVHYDGVTSPLAGDPDRFTAPLRRSKALRAIRAGGRRLPAAEPPADRPLRLLFLYCANANFLPVITGHYGSAESVETRVLDTATDPELAPLAKGEGRIAAAALGGRAPYRRAVEAALRPHLDRADVVFVDWCTSAAAFLTLVDPGTTRVIVRLHSFEAFDRWPHLTRFGRVDDLVFVSAHLRDLAVRTFPALRGEDAPRLHVLSNAMDLTRFVRPKPTEARFTLGLVGAAHVAKDPRWALEVLRILRTHEPRFRLKIIGDLTYPSLSPAAARYRTALDKDLGDAGGSVVLHGQTSDVPSALADVGVILSSSLRESFHIGLLEGVAGGAVPVVRDWPFFAGHEHGARTLFPASWVVADPHEAARRILEATASEETWRAAGTAAADHALATWDWDVVRHDYDRLLLPGAGPVSSAGDDASRIPAPRPVSAAGDDASRKAEV